MIGESICMLDLTKENDAYFYGLLMADANLYLTTRNRGKVGLELVDKDIINKIHKTYGGSTSSRTRKTNYSDELISYTWSRYDKQFRDELISYGFTSGNRQYHRRVPNVKYNEKGFWRGIADGNGSIGITSNKFPFLSLTIKSEELKNNYLCFIENNFNILKKINRNKRDNIYNICHYKEDAQVISRFLYKDSDLYVDRKYSKYLEIDSWIRPKNMKKKGLVNDYIKWKIQ